MRISDWSSDVCSSDLIEITAAGGLREAMITSSLDLITIGLARLVSEDVKAIPCHALRMLAMHQVDIILPRVLGLLDLPNFEIARDLQDAAQCRIIFGMPDHILLQIGRASCRAGEFP